MSQLDSASAPPSPTVGGGWRALLGSWSLAGISLLSLPAIAGFAGRFWWVLELAGHFRIQYFWGFLVGTILLIVGRRNRAATVAGTLLFVHATMLWPFYEPLKQKNQSTVPRLRLASINLLVENAHHTEVLQFVRDASPDVVLFFEVDRVWSDVLQELSKDWPYHQTRSQRNNFGLAFFSRLPIEDLHLEFLGKNYPAIVARVIVDGTPITIFGAHPMSPMSKLRHSHRDWQMKKLGTLIAEAPGEKLLVGDLNCTSWSPAFRDLLVRSRLRDSRLGRGVQSSWPTSLPAMMRIPIDHCLISSGIEVDDRQLGPHIGSDHLPIVVDLKFQQTPKGEKSD